MRRAGRHRERREEAADERVGVRRRDGAVRRREPSAPARERSSSKRRGLRRRRRPRADLSLSTVKHVLRGLPRFGRLLLRLMKDSRVSPVDRALFGFTLVYLFTPLDVVPDWIPVLGQLDDVALLAVALYRLLDRVDEDVLLEHWGGEEEPLWVLRDLLDRSMGMLPRWTRRLITAT